jgi:uncharacterized protein YoxC
MAEVDDPEVDDLTETRRALEDEVPDYPDARQSSSNNVTVQDMYELLSVLRDGLASRDKAVDYLQKQIELNQRQIEQNKKIIAKRGVITRLIIAVVAFGVLAVGFDQHTIIRSFDKDMTNVSNDMDVMMVEMTEMRKSIQAMSADINSMSEDFSSVARDVSSISYGVHGMSYDTRQMNRQMDTMTPPWSPFK